MPLLLVLGFMVTSLARLGSIPGGGILMTLALQVERLTLVEAFVLCLGISGLYRGRSFGESFWLCRLWMPCTESS